LEISGCDNKGVDVGGHPIAASRRASAVTRVRLTVGNRPVYRGNWPYRPGPVTVPTGYQPLGLKNFEFKFQKLKIVEKSLKILCDLLNAMVSNLLQT
jgi:hypothetical protein